MIVKLHNLHWNVVGPEFLPVHNFTEQQYDEYFGWYDDVAEALKMRGERPLVTLKSYLAASSIQELEDRDFTAKEVLDIVKADMEAMNALAVEIREVADAEGDFGVVAMMEDHVAANTKQLWFISAMQK